MTMLLFRSEEARDQWCADRGRARGDTLSLDQIWRLAQLWYSDRLDPAYQGRSAAQAQAIFAQVGLTSPFWQASSS
jgi:hypothetical protein